jgi:hypothetical protein
MRDQPLDLRDDGAHTAKLALKILARGIFIRRPGLGDEACTRTDAECGVRVVLDAQCDGLTDQAGWQP